MKGPVLSVGGVASVGGVGRLGSVGSLGSLGKDGPKVESLRNIGLRQRLYF